jgi:hypothetical protein
MAESIVPDAPHGTGAGYERGCRCQWCQLAGKHINADGTPPGGLPQTPRKASPSRHG